MSPTGSRHRGTWRSPWSSSPWWCSEDHSGPARHASPRPRRRRIDRGQRRHRRLFPISVPGGHDPLRRCMMSGRAAPSSDPERARRLPDPPGAVCAAVGASSPTVLSNRSGNSIALGIMALAILLAFSRAVSGAASPSTSAFMLALMVLTSQVPGAALAHCRDVGGRGDHRGAAGRRPAVVRSDPRRCSTSAPASIKATTKAKLRPLRPAHPRRRHGARPAVRHRPAAVPQLFSPRTIPQPLPQRLHVGRLDRRRLLSGAGVHHRHHGVSPRLRAPVQALAACLSGRSSPRSSAPSAKVLSSTPTTGGTSG